MKPASIKEIKTELNNRSSDELRLLCLRLAKHKVENKELLSYLLFEVNDEDHYISEIKHNIDNQFALVNRRSYYTVKKGVQKIIAEIKKNIKYSKLCVTEVELLLHFCEQLKEFKPSIQRSAVVMNIYNREKGMLGKAIGKLHEDLQFDYQDAFENL